MCRALVYRKPQATHPDPLVDAMLYKPGMIITVIEDDQEFGALDVGPHSFVMEVPGVPAADLAALYAPQTRRETVVNKGGTFTRVDVVGLRRYRAKTGIVLPVRKVLARAQVAAFIAENFDLRADPQDAVVIS